MIHISKVFFSLLCFYFFRVALFLPALDSLSCLRLSLLFLLYRAALNMKIQQWPQDWKRSVFIPIPKKGNAKECSNNCTVALISQTSKVMLKVLQARLQQYVNHELPEFQAGFRKGRGTRDQIANICWIIEKAREFQKNIYVCFIDYAKAFDCVDHNCRKFFKRWEYQSSLLPPEKSVCRSRSNS